MAEKPVANPPPIGYNLDESKETTVVAEQSYSPLGMEASPLAAFWSTVSQGWPGIVIQLASMPAIVGLVERFAAISTKGRQA